MSEDEIRDLKRQQKAEVLLEIDDLDGTVLCLRKALVRIQRDLSGRLIPPYHRHLA